MRRATAPNLMRATVAGTLRMPSVGKIMSRGFQFPKLAYAEPVPNVLAGLRTVPSSGRATLFSVLFLLALVVVVTGCSKVAGQSSTASPFPVTRERQPAVSLSYPGEDEPLRIQILASDITASELRVQRIDLGSIYQGESIRRAIVVENKCSESVTVDRFGSSCECLSFKPLPLTVLAGQSKTVTMVVDESIDDEFHGKLWIDTSAYAGAKRLFCVQVILDVQPRKSNR